MDGILWVHRLVSLIINSLFEVICWPNINNTLSIIPLREGGESDNQYD